MSDFPKQYDPKISEPQSQSVWKTHEVSLPKEWTTGKTFYIPIPPPNVTGNLHIWHALTLSIEDIMTRYHRMRGDTTLWVPGTDHAGIATQAQVEKRVEKNGNSRKELGREKFLEECWKWINEYGGNIHNQMHLLGASVDRTKERFTFDPQYNNLVEKTFIDLYNKWLIYRGEYMVNYSPALESVISDIEVEHVEVEEKMYYINYFVAGSDKELLVATTRPETLLADQAVAVHPKDKRYKKLIWKSVILPIVNKEIPIIADPMVDMEFGTGVVKITPAHDPADFETGKRHGLKLDYRVIDKNGTMTADAWVFAGLKAAEEARSNIVELLKSKGNLVKTEPYTHKVWFCSRGKCRIESVVSTQWFVKASVMAEKVIAGYKKKEFVIVPDRFNKTFEDWIYNLRDWCISRQLWWGHQIPAYYHGETGELLWVTLDPSWIYDTYGRENVRRDDDVLDTWFSSGMWPFAVLNWDFENPSELFKKFYPANVLETGYDILFFWVIRMLLMGYEYTGETPFKTIYLHGLILDENGKKMSKSWGNVIDPLDIIGKYSADALRLTCVLDNTPGNNLNFSTKTVEEYSLFLNKFWNIIRFTWINVGTIETDRKTLREKIQKNESDLLPYEQWILSRLTRIIDLTTEWMDTNNFGGVGSELITFIRSEFADLAIEAYKVEKDYSPLGKDVLALVALEILALLHPYAPHITESLYWYITNGKVLAEAEWPVSFYTRNVLQEESLEKVFSIVRTIRNIRAEAGIKPGEFRDVKILSHKNQYENLLANANLLKWLTRTEKLSINDKGHKLENASYGVIGGFEIYVDTQIDPNKSEEEKQKILEQLEEKKEYLRVLETKLANSTFIKNAPEKIVRIEMEKKNQTLEQIEKLEAKYQSLTKK
jgi:valyl-tRNA synthetase